MCQKFTTFYEFNEEKLVRKAFTNSLPFHARFLWTHLL